MAEPLKNLYNKDNISRLIDILKTLHPPIKKEAILSSIFNDEWEEKELKERMRHISLSFIDHLPKDFEQLSNLLIDLIDEHNKREIPAGFEHIFIPDVIELTGLDHLELSCRALECITQFISCEFAVRPFIIRYPNEMMDQMLTWSNHDHHYVRRFSSEGCRPRLPWAMALPHLKKDPSPILPILENLKNDPTEFVRKSVANNLNDISKDHPDLVLDISERWQGQTKETDWIVKHANRTMLKAGNTRAMEMFGFASPKKIKISNFKVLTPKVKQGDYLEFSFDLANTGSKSALIRLEYAMYYMKSNGKQSRKVFSISEKQYDGKSTTSIKRRQSFKPITTRKYYPGEHGVAVIVNGKEFESHDFILI